MGNFILRENIVMLLLFPRINLFKSISTQSIVWLDAQVSRKGALLIH